MQCTSCLLNAASEDRGVLLAHRLVWVLAHSSENKDVGRGLRFAEELLRDKSLNAQDQRDLVYLTAVASYKLGKVCACWLQGVHLQGVYILSDHTACCCLVQP